MTLPRIFFNIRCWISHSRYLEGGSGYLLPILHRHAKAGTASIRSCTCGKSSRLNRKQAPPAAGSCHWDFLLSPPPVLVPILQWILQSTPTSLSLSNSNSSPPGPQSKAPHSPASSPACQMSNVSCKLEPCKFGHLTY